MKSGISRLFRRSFRLRLFLAFLCVAMVPLAVSLWLTGRIFRSQQHQSAFQEMDKELEVITGILDGMHAEFLRASEGITGDPVIIQALSSEEGGVRSTSVNNRLFDATARGREYASFDIYDRDGVRRYSTTGEQAEKRLPAEWGILKKAAGSGELVYMSTEDASRVSEPLLTGAAVIRNGGETAGYLVIDVSYENLQTLLEGKYGAQNELLLLNRYWHPVYCEQPLLVEELAPLLRNALLKGEELSGVDQEFLYSSAEHPATGLNAVLRSPEVFTDDTNALLRRVILLTMLFGAAAAILIAFGLSEQMFRPVERLRSAMSEVTLDNLDVQVQTGEDELGELAVRFNRMTGALRENRATLIANQEKLVQNQRELNEAQIRMLQAQLNPHFLGNTLDTMKWIAKINRVPEVAVMSTDLADILRFAISPGEFSTLAQEIEVLERYLEIQQIRQSGGISFLKEVPEELESCRVPRMMLQPLVENAVIHGLDSTAGGEIILRAERIEEEEGKPLLRVTVTDNGSGLPEGMTGPYRRPEGEGARHHLGLYNVDTILKKHFGEEFGLRLSNREDGRSGAVVTAVLPLIAGAGHAAAQEAADMDTEEEEGNA